MTIGTGLGSALFSDGHLVPNTELGHIEMDGREGEAYASDAARKRNHLSIKNWAKRFNLYLNTLEKLLWPDLIILGGGISKEFEAFRAELKVKAELVPAQALNEAGIIGAALAAIELRAVEEKGGLNTKTALQAGLPSGLYAVL